MRSLSVSLILVVLLGLIGLGWLFDALYAHYRDEPDAQPAEVALVQGLADMLNRQDDPRQVIAHWPEQQPQQLMLIDSEQFALPGILREQLLRGEVLQLQDDREQSFAAFLPAHQAIVILQQPMLATDGDTSSVRWLFTGGFYTLLIGLLIVWLMPLLTRLARLKAAAMAFGQGDLQSRVAVGGRSYIRDLENEFNHMAQRIDDLVADVKLLSSAVSHDLRTPLAKLQLGLDTLAEESDPIKRQQYEERLHQHIDDMVELIEALLEYARLDQAMVNLHIHPLDLNALVTTLVGRYHGERPIDWQPCAQPVWITADVRYISRAINNVLDNALRFARHTVQVRLTCTTGTVTLCIEDDGPGIDASQVEKIFKPFVRAPGQNAKQGYGLGLAFVRRVMEWHQGSVLATQGRVLKGACFELTLPTDTATHKNQTAGQHRRADRGE